MIRSLLEKRWVDALTVISAVCVIVLASMVVWERYIDSGLVGRRQDRVIENWEAYASGGHRIGPVQAKVTIVEFGDYQCPACRTFNPRLQAVQAEFPDDVAVVHRHWPLPQHAAAHLAARAAECAAQQGKFEAFHEFLYTNSDWMADTRATFMIAGERMLFPDLEGFRACVNSIDPVDSIEIDTIAAESLDSFGTPTILINNLLLGSVPDQERLREFVLRGLGK